MLHGSKQGYVYSVYMYIMYISSFTKKKKKQLWLSLLLDCHDPKWIQEYSDGFIGSSSSSSTRWVRTLVPSHSFLYTWVNSVHRKEKRENFLLRTGLFNLVRDIYHYCSEF